jgi:hypothetical protein
MKNRGYLNATVQMDAGGSGTPPTKTPPLNPDWVELLMGWPYKWTYLDPMSMIQYDKWLMGFTDEKKERAAEKVSDVREGDATAALRSAAGGYVPLQGAEVLQPALREHPQESGAPGLALARTADEGETLRSVRHSEAPTGSPYGREHHEPVAEESPNALYLVPPLCPSYGPAAWQDGSWETGIPRVADGVKNRMDRLAAIGDGQVPAVVKAAWRLLKGEP